jgi:hypothetical protein
MMAGMKSVTVTLAISRNLLYKNTCANALHLEKKHVSNVQKLRRIFMKKLVLCVLSVALLSIGMVGCGNSPDGDKQKLEAPSSLAL